MQETNCCSECFRKNPVTENNKCNVCGHMALSAKYSGFSLYLECHHCGYSVVGASFYAPCEIYHERFTIIVNRVPFSSMVAVRKCIHRGVVEIKQAMDRGEPIIIGDLNLEEALQIVCNLQDLGSDCNCEPDPSTIFPEITTCSERIPIGKD